MVVFSGGEAFLLKDDLFAAISHVTFHGKMSRVVSNGFWGKSAGRAGKVADQLVEAGLTELNLSTGRDHQQWVGEEAVVNAAVAAVERGVRVLITVEKDGDDSACFGSLARNIEIQRLQKRFSDRFILRSNSWMPFHESARPRGSFDSTRELRSGCSQLMRNLVITPYRQLSACCGLTFEHIPEMKLGNLGGASLRELYESQYDDFMKVWLAVDGPYRIIERLTTETERKDLGQVVHLCQACVLLHRHPVLRERARDRYEEFVPEVLARFGLKRTLEAREATTFE